MQTTLKALPWWMVIVTGVLILGAGIFLLVSPADGLGILTFLLGVGVLGFGLYNIYKAIRFKDNNRLFIPSLIHGLLDMVLLLLIVVIRNSPAHLGVILASWFIIFGVFGVVHARQDGDGKTRSRISALLILIGVVLIILPFLLRMDHVVFLGIVSIIIGVVRTAQGVVSKIRQNARVSGGRANLL